MHSRKTEEKFSSDICILIEDEEPLICPAKHTGKNPSPSGKSSGNEAVPKTQTRKDLRKFNLSYDEYRKFQPKQGKDTRISSGGQVHVKPKKMFKIDECQSKEIWNPNILSEIESNFISPEIKS